MLTPEETARRRRINKILLPIVGLVVLAIVVAIVLINVSEKRTEDERVEEAMASAAPPDMTDEEFADFHERLGKIHPDLVDNGIRAHARDTCSSLDSDQLVDNTIVRFSSADHDVTEDEAQQIVDLINDIGFCDR
ncbi:hypothetical protein PGC08_14335 [Brevibacterium sp. BDJS002]|uniref:hypothetical protein n=1 Tax=Brevibacterium sp. BDJS002 TaxID=3020906 RepID=UPI002307DD50|nr:hypothetical protein [Brevibacterium sp. BDJS002]WCE39168.1 hypothetical protein PGC08_14335 [Brevibacterium sp. BDJS002]